MTYVQQFCDFLNAEKFFHCCTFFVSYKALKEAKIKLRSRIMRFNWFGYKKGCSPEGTALNFEDILKNQSRFPSLSKSTGFPRPSFLNGSS